MFKTCTAYALVAALGLGGWMPATSIAANVTYYPPGSTPQPIEVARMLAGPQFKPALKMRGVQIVGGAQAMPRDPLAPASGQPPPIIFAEASVPFHTAALAQTPLSPAVAAPTESPPETSQAFAVSVPFAFNSAKLQPAAFEALDNIAEGIKLVRLPRDLVIEGHTDAIGGDVYNMKLSVRRAAAVKRYFAQQHGIAATKLRAVGKGRAEPLNRANPFAPENRRVQFRLA